MSLMTRFRKNRTKTGKQTRPEAETQTNSMSIKTAGAETKPLDMEFVESALEIIRENHRKDPTWYKRCEKFWLETGEYKQYL